MPSPPNGGRAHAITVIILNYDRNSMGVAGGHINVRCQQARVLAGDHCFQRLLLWSISAGSEEIVGGRCPLLPSSVEPVPDQEHCVRAEVRDSKSQIGYRIMRYELADYEWTAIRPMLPNKPRGVPRVNDRRVLNGIFWVLRSGAGVICRRHLARIPLATTDSSAGGGLVSGAAS